MSDCGFQGTPARCHDGELPAEERRRFEDHLAGCIECTAELRQLRALSGLLSATEALPVPDGMIERLHKDVRPVRELEIIRICRVAALAAAAVLAVCGVWLWQAEPADQAHVSAPADWEIVAVTGDADLVQVGSDDAYALWMVRNLSGEAAQ